MARVRLFASARQAAGTASDEIAGRTVDEVLQVAAEKFGADFVAVLKTCRVWLNGEEAIGTTAVGDADEVAILPPVSGGCAILTEFAISTT
ncbi:MAG: molybdopterin synthase sulfur carrier subunit [Acidimicrobium sp.]|nr:MAG: molybdopterin synthase sulfur carrier subunit [Acidimicrobium sp.]